MVFVRFRVLFSVNREGRGGGMAVLWKYVKHYSIKSYSNNHIDAIFQDTRTENWRLTGYYGHPDVSRRRTSWNLIRNLAESSNIPWCILGNFYDILSSDEKRESGKENSIN